MDSEKYLLIRFESTLDRSDDFFEFVVQSEFNALYETFPLRIGYLHRYAHARCHNYRREDVAVFGSDDFFVDSCDSEDFLPEIPLQGNGGNSGIKSIRIRRTRSDIGTQFVMSPDIARFDYHFFHEFSYRENEVFVNTYRVF